MGLVCWGHCESFYEAFSDCLLWWRSLSQGMWQSVRNQSCAQQSSVVRSVLSSQGQTSQGQHVLKVSDLDLQGRWVPPSIDVFFFYLAPVKPGTQYFISLSFSFKLIDALWQTVLPWDVWSLDNQGPFPQLYIFPLVSTGRWRTDMSSHVKGFCQTLLLFLPGQGPAQESW